MKITLLTGGARSGKSSYAIKLASSYTGKKAFIATATAFDDEMKTRIINHQSERQNTFETIEEPVNISSIIKNLSKNYSVIVIDCLTVWIGNLFYTCQDNEKEILSHVNEFVEALKQSECDVIIVTNEVGWGIVPENKMARSYRDIAGFTNQAIAAIAQNVMLFCSGIPVVIKGENAAHV